jgi:hypothetical protein
LFIEACLGFSSNDTQSFGMIIFNHAKKQIQNYLNILIL